MQLLASSIKKPCIYGCHVSWPQNVLQTAAGLPGVLHMLLGLALEELMVCQLCGRISLLCHHALTAWQRWANGVLDLAQDAD